MKDLTRNSPVFISPSSDKVRIFFCKCNHFVIEFTQPLTTFQFCLAGLFLETEDRGKMGPNVSAQIIHDVKNTILAVFFCSY